VKTCQGPDCSNQRPPGARKYCSNECARRKQNQHASTRASTAKERPVEASVLYTSLALSCVVDSEGSAYVTSSPIPDDEKDADAEISELVSDFERFSHWARAVGRRGPTE